MDDIKTPFPEQGLGFLLCSNPMTEKLKVGCPKSICKPIAPLLHQM